jgi:pimeloyl-ACP methyl ester carboxylesterase
VQNDHTRSPELTSVAAGGLSFAVWDWPGQHPTLLFAHATGFHGRCWDHVICRFPSQRCLAMEARGHGRSSKPAPPYRWGAFGPDMRVVLGRLGVRGAIGIGHSMGGHTVTAVSALRPATFSALLLVDPTIREPEAYGTTPLDASFVRRRRARFSSAKEMFEHYRHRSPFKSWKPEVLRDYCDFGLLPSDSAFVLACPPEVEASIYECAKEAEANLHAVIPSVTRPVTVLRAGYSGPRTLSTSPTDPRLASRFPHGREVLLRDHSHFIPMETPELVAEEIRRFL